MDKKRPKELKIRGPFLTFAEARRLAAQLDLKITGFFRQVGKEERVWVTFNRDF
jgi:hypothetical protein